MDRKYTAEEMRSAAFGFGSWPEDQLATVGPAVRPEDEPATIFRSYDIAAMLSQAAGMIERATNVIKANAKGIENRHRDADAVLVTAEYILTGRR